MCLIIHHFFDVQYAKGPRRKIYLTPLCTSLKAESGWSRERDPVPILLQLGVKLSRTLPASQSLSAMNVLCLIFVQVSRDSKLL